MQEKTIHTPSPKNFNLMVSGQIISILGSALLRFALSLYVLDTTGSGSLFATLFAISNIPLLLAPLGGAIADRFNRRNLMVIFDFTSSAIVLSLIILMSVGSISVFTAGTSMVLLSIVSALYTPAVTASIPLLVEEQKLEGANGLVQAVQALSAVAAPVLGGILYGLMGLKIVVAVSCISFFLSAVMELFIQIPFVKRQWTGPVIPAIARDMKEGFTYVLKQEFIRKVSMIAVLLNLVLIPYFLVGAPIVLRVTMQSSDTLYGIGMGLINSATILGALSIGFFAKKMSLKTLHRWLFACCPDDGADGSIPNAPFAWAGVLPFVYPVHAGRHPYCGKHDGHLHLHHHKGPKNNTGQKPWKGHGNHYCSLPMRSAPGPDTVRRYL